MSKPSAFGLNSILDQLQPLRHTKLRLLLALALVVIALASTWTAELFWRSSAPLIFAAAIAVSTILFGFLAGLTTALLSTLTVDFFYIPPVFALNLDRSTLLVALQFTLLSVVVHVVARQASAGIRRKAKLGVFGQLDGVVDGEAYGWALNADDPAAPVNVMLYLNHRPVAEAAAVYYRPDVATNMNCSGRHGFYVDLSDYCLTDTDAEVEARFPQNPPANAVVHARIPAGITRQSQPTVLFMHIPRTSGTSFREAIVENYKQAEIAYLYPDPPGFLVQDLSCLPFQQRSWFRLVVGHFRYGIHELLPQESTYISVVRHPFARVISHYLYLLKLQPALLTDKGRQLELEEVLERQISADLDNAMVRCFGGIDEKDVLPGMVNHEAYERAVHYLRTAFTFVGYQECASESYAALSERFNWKPNPELNMLNQTPNISSLAHESKIRKAVEYYNRWDYLFYEEVLRVFPLHEFQSNRLKAW